MPIPELTDDFVETFSNPEETYKGAFAHMVGSGLLPDGVDGDDARVVAIVVKCKEANGAQ